MFFTKSIAAATVLAAGAFAAPAPAPSSHPTPQTNHTTHYSVPPPPAPPADDHYYEAPTTTVPTGYTPTVELTGVTHSVTAGLGGLRFEPDNIVAEVGDVVEWRFLPANHSVVQSSFGQPCVPLEDGTGFFSGFNFRTAEGLAPDVFQIVVEDTTPIWFYCSQTNGNHCQSGMNGVINQNFDNQAFSLRAHRELAARSGTSVSPPVAQGGYIIPNPNPNGGF